MTLNRCNKTFPPKLLDISRESILTHHYATFFITLFLQLTRCSRKRQFFLNKKYLIYGCSTCNRQSLYSECRSCWCLQSYIFPFVFSRIIAKNDFGCSVSFQKWILIRFSKKSNER